MLSERTIINGLILIAGMLLGPYLIILTLEGSQMGILAFAGIVFLFCVFFLLKDRIAFGPLLAGSFAGSLNFLPFGLKPVELVSLVLILYYGVHYVALKKRAITFGPLYFLIPMLVVTAIVLYHDHNLGLKAIGSSGAEGSRPGLLIIIAFVTYLCAINIPTSSALWVWSIPLWCLCLNIIGSAPFILTTYFPSLAPYLFYFSGNVNLAAYAESVGSSSADVTDVGRNGSFIGISTALQLVLVAYFAINTWWRPSRWIVIILSFLCFYGVVYGGYRNALLSYILIMLLGAISYCHWRVLILLPLLVLAPLAMIVVQNQHPGGMALPATVQRSLSFLPGGNWDRNVAESTASSNDFREQIANVYIKEYLRKSPLLGNGFTFDPSESEGLEAMTHTPGISDPNYFFIKSFIVTKNFHVGWISLYDAVGIIGGIAFVALNITMCWTAGSFVFGGTADTRASFFPVKVWLFCNLITAFIGYFTTFGSFSASFISLCAFSILLVHLKRIDQRDTFQTVSPSPKAPLGALNRAENFTSPKLQY